MMMLPNLDKSSDAEGRMTDMNGKDLPVVDMYMVMEQAVGSKIYQYLVE